MSKEEALAYCYKHRDEYIRDHDSIVEGTEQFECLITILEAGTITPDQISDYGMEF